MKQLLTVLLCLLLLGCTPKADTLPTEAVPETTDASVPVHPLEQSYPGLIRVFPLTPRKVHGIRAIGSDILVLSGTDSTTLTMLTGEHLREAAAYTVEFSLFQDDPSLRVHGNGISFYDPLQQATLLLDRQLQEIRRIAVPAGLSGKPILSYDTNTLFYCTQWSIVAWDLETGIRRTVKELAYSAQELTGLHWDDQILECTILEDDHSSKLLLSSDNGTEAAALQANAQISTGNAGFCAMLPDGFQTVMLFGDGQSPVELLLPNMYPDQQYYLDQDHAVVTAAFSPEGISLDCYALDTGVLLASLTLNRLQTPENIVNASDHFLYILAYDPDVDCHMLYRWDPFRQEADPSNAVSHTSVYHSDLSADAESLEQCRQYAHSIGEAYGITIRLGEEACSVQPWDYRFTPEYLAPVLMKELALLEQRLARYPDGILEKSASHFTGLTLCLVRQIDGTDESNSLDSATGIQFFEDDHAYVVIATGKHSEQALYHELYHVMETHILTDSVALDQWEALNPGGFSYGGNPDASDIYLQGQTRAFVDSYSMRYPKEDRARIMEHAMLHDNESTFRSEYMQRKLTALCRGIREAYGLKKYPDALPWESYLVTPLIPDT